MVGHGAGLRLENRLPGGDVNPYLALAGMLASGLRGIDQELRARAGVRGQRLPVRPPQGPDLAAGGPRPVRGLLGRAREMLGDAVVDHYVNNADVELAAFDAAVTDWERYRSFERM